jgi:hypothetical protein
MEEKTYVRAGIRDERAHAAGAEKAHFSWWIFLPVEQAATVGLMCLAAPVVATVLVACIVVLVGDART